MRSKRSHLVIGSLLALAVCAAVTTAFLYASRTQNVRYRVTFQPFEQWSWGAGKAYGGYTLGIAQLTPDADPETVKDATSPALSCEPFYLGPVHITKIIDHQVLSP